MSNKQVSRPRRRSTLGIEQLESKRLLAGDLTNPINALDVNNDSEVTATDALAIINYMYRMQVSGQDTPIGALNDVGKTIFPDANGNGSVAASDALSVINALAEGEQKGDEVHSQSYGPMAIHFDPGHNPKVKFSGTGMDVRVTTPQPGHLRFQADGLDQTIGIRHDLHIDASGSNNRWLFDGAVIPDDLLIKFSGSDNAIRLSGSHVGDDLIFHGSDGREAVMMDDETFIGDDVIIKTKSGEDLVVVVSSTIDDDLIYHAGDGNDGLCLENSQIGDDLVVRMGDHNDQVALHDIVVRDVADVEGDRHYDTLAASNLIARRYRPDDFEAQGGMEDCQEMIDAIFAGFGGGDDNGYEPVPDGVS